MNKEHSFIETILKYRQIPVIIVIALCLAGIYSFATMPRQEFPDFKIRQGLVIAAFPGATSEQADSEVAKPLMDYLFTYSETDRDKTYAVSKENQVIVFLTVGQDVSDPDAFWSKLRLGLHDFKPQLPIQTLLLQGDNDFGSASAILLSIASDKRTYRELENQLNELAALIRTDESVSRTSGFGLQKEQIAIYADPFKLAYYALKPAVLMSALQLESLVGYGASVTNKELEMPVTLSGEFASEAEIAEQIVYSSPNDAIVRVKDIAEVKREYNTESSFVETDGKKTVVLSMEMLNGKNIVSFGKQIDKFIEKFKAESFADIELIKLADMPSIVNTSITHFFRDFGLAILSVIVVIVFFLPRRVAAVSAMTIPIVVTISILVIHLAGIQLNTVSLASLVMVLGMVVDDSVVVIDNHIEKLDEGLSPWKAACLSARELLLPVLTATSAIIAAFAPVTFFLGGMYKEFLTPVPWTVSLSLIASLIVALFFVPILTHKFIKRGITVKVKGKKTFLDRAQDFYDKNINVTMSRPKLTLTIAAFLICAGIALLLLLPQQIFPKLDRNQFAVEIYFPEGTSLDKNAQVTRELAQLLSGDKRVRHVVSFIGSSSPRFNTLYAPQIPAKNYSQLIVMTGSEKETVQVLREYDAAYRDYFPSAHIRFKQLDFLPVDAPLEIQIYGDSIDEIKMTAADVKKILTAQDGVIWVKDDYRNPRIVADLKIDKETANRLGISRASLGLSAALNRQGVPVAQVWEKNYMLDVFLKYSPSPNSFAEDLLDQYAFSPVSSKPVLIKQVASIAPAFSEGQIVRRNGRYAITVSADISSTSYASDILSAVKPNIEALSLPENISIRYGGEYAMQRETYGAFAQSLFTSAILIFMILLFQFKKVKLALLVMLTMPLSLIGGALGLFVIGYPFGMTSFIGFIGLFGIVIRNGIILISYARELQETKGLPVKEAAIAAGKRRMRPIFLTASAAAVGVVPLITSGSLLWGPCGTVICFGLVGSTLLTLFVLPVAYWQFSKNSTQEKQDEVV